MSNIIMTASNILVSELKTSRRYMSLSMRMFSTRANLNHVAVTEAFIDDIIANKEEYVCMPLCADVPKLKKKDYRGLTHLYDEDTGTFLADRIGSFYDFEKVSDEYGVSLIGHARVDKRSKAVCEAIEELYANNALNFSFEISAGELRTENGITIVDASATNELTAMAIVSVPAYPESKALDLVAEADASIDKLYEHTRFIAAEMDVETVKRKFFKCLESAVGADSWHLRPLLFCTDCVILYDEMEGYSYKAEYLLNDDDFILKDFYQIEFKRTTGSENHMNEPITEKIDNAMPVEAEAHIEEPVSADESVTTVSAEAETTEVAAENNAPVLENTDEEDKEDVDDKNEKDDEEEELLAMRQRVAELEAQVNELQGFKAELDNIRAEQAKAETEARMAELREYAVAEGLDVESETVAKAIAELNHAALVAEVIAHKKNTKASEAQNTVAASYCDIKPTGSVGYLLGHAE